MTAVPSLGRPPALNPTHIKWRVDSDPHTQNGQTTARFVPYVTMEHLADMLDAWVTPSRWWAEFTPASHEMWCNITILVPNNSVFVKVTKTDVGDLEGSAKAAVSDSFKRCATRMWGVGREVRSIPTLWAPCRVYTARGKEIAAPNNNTIPTLRRKLADLGHAGIGDDVDGSDQLDPDAKPGQPEPSTPVRPNDIVDVLTDALDQLGNQVEQLNDTSRHGWAEWKVANTDWQKTIAGVDAATCAVDRLLEQQTVTQIAAGPAIPQPVPAAPTEPSEEAGDEPFRVDAATWWPGAWGTYPRRLL